MIAIILAAGYGTRLYPLTINKAKALIEIKGKPLLAYLLDKIEKSKIINKIYIITNNKFYNKFKEFLKNFNYKKEIELINDQTNDEKEKLGAIGDLYYGIKSLNVNEDILVMASDFLFDFEIDDFINFYKIKNRTCVAVYDIKDFNKAKRLGVIEINKDNKIISFEEKPENPKTTLISAASYVLKKEDIELLNKYTKIEDAKEALGNLITYFIKNVDVYAYIFKGRLFDLGNVSDLELARKEL